MAMLKIGLIGAGGRGTAHLKTIVEMTDRYELVGICDINQERLDEASAKFGAPGFLDAAELMDQVKPEALAVITSQRELPKIVQAAADRGIHVATETPIADTLPKADELIGIAKKGGIKLENFEQTWRWPREHLKRQILASGVLGEKIQVRYYSHVAPYHAMGAFLRLADSRVKSVIGFGRDLPMAPTPKDSDRVTRRWVVAGIEFENGLPGVLEIKIARTNMTGHDFTNCSLECSQGHIYHDAIYIAKDAIKPKEGGQHKDMRGVVHYPIQEGWEEIKGRRILTKAWIDTDPEIAWENPYKQYAPEAAHASTDDYGRLEEHIDWHRAVTEDTEPEYTAEMARHNIEVLIAAHHSAENGSPLLTMPIDPTITTTFW